eukprot:jgi/Chrzof1/98/Cz01g03130.t1
MQASPAASATDQQQPLPKRPKAAINHHTTNPARSSNNKAESEKKPTKTSNADEELKRYKLAAVAAARQVAHLPNRYWHSGKSFHVLMNRSQMVTIRWHTKNKNYEVRIEDVTTSNEVGESMHAAAARLPEGPLLDRRLNNWGYVGTILWPFTDVEDILVSCSTSAVSLQSSYAVGQKDCDAFLM